MKFNEIKEGVEYICSDCFYKLEGGKLLVKLDGECDYRESFLSYNEVFAQDFIECNPPIDWSYIPIDTKILVRIDDKDTWTRRHFAKYDHNEIFAWNDGKTSFTTNPNQCSSWSQAKLYKE